MQHRYILRRGILCEDLLWNGNVMRVLDAIKDSLNIVNVDHYNLKCLMKKNQREIGGNVYEI